MVMSSWRRAISVAKSCWLSGLSDSIRGSISTAADDRKGQNGPTGVNALRLVLVLVGEALVPSEGPGMILIIVCVFTVKAETETDPVRAKNTENKTLLDGLDEFAIREMLGKVLMETEVDKNDSQCIFLFST